MVALSLLVARPAAAQSPPAQSPPAPTSTIRLADQTTWVGDGGTFRVGMTVTTPDAGARLQLSVYHALTTRTDFTESLADRIHTNRIVVFDPVALTKLGSSPAMSVVVNPKASSRAPQAVHLSGSGVYPVRVDLVDGAGNLLSRLTTHLLYSAPDLTGITRLDVAWVVPFHATPATGTPAAALAPDADLAGLQNLSAALAVHESVPVTLAAVPQTVEALAGGTPNDRTAVAQMTQALSLGNRQVVASPYVRIDLPAMIGAGLDGEIATQLSTGSDVLAANLHAVATGATWVEFGPLTPGAVDDLFARGVRQIVVADKSLMPLPAEDRARTPAQPFTVVGKASRLAAVAADAGLGAHFVDNGDELLAAHQLLADLAMVQLELPNRRGGRGVAIVPPPAWHPDATFLATVLDGLATAPTLAPVTVDRLLSDVTPLLAGANPLARAVAPPDQQPRSQAIGDAAAIRAARRPVSSLAAVVPAGTSAIAEIQRHLLISESADIADRARPVEVAAATSLIDRLKGMARLPGNQSITFTARQGLIPITILSSASFPLRVRMRVTSQKLGFLPVELPGGGCTVESGTSEICDVDLRAQNTTVRVPVVAKTAGVFSLTVTLDSPDGALILASNQDTVRSTAASGVGVFLSIGAVLLLAVWWARDVVHGRRARRLVPKRFDWPEEPPPAAFAATAILGDGPSTRATSKRPPPPPPAPAAARAGVATIARVADWDDPWALTTQPSPVILADLPAPTPKPAVGRPSPPRPPPEPSPADSFSRNTAVMAAGTLLSRITGFGRVLALVWAFGIASGLTDVFTVANTAPNILYDLVLGGILSATLVPVFVDYLGRDDPEEGRRAVSAVVTAITATLLGLSVVFWLAAPAIIRVYLVLNTSSGAADERAIGTALLHMFVPQLFLLGGIAVTTALLNARRQFAAVAFSPVVNNVVAIGAIVAARMIATSVTLPGFRADQSALLILGLGTTAGYLFQFLVQLPPIVRGGLRLRPVWDLRHPAVRTVLRLSLWTFGSVMANQVSFNLILVLADHRRGDVAVFSTAYQFFQLPYAIFAVSIASVITPDLSEHWAKRDLDGFRRQMANGLRLTMAVLLPAAAGYVVLAQPFLHLVLRHGSFSSADAHRIGAVVALFAIGLPGFSAYLLLMRAYQAMQDTRSMFFLYLVENVATLVLAGALYPVMGVRGLALGWVGAYTVGSVAAFAHLRRRTGGLAGQAIVAGLVRVAAATALMMIPVFALAHLVRGESLLASLAQVGGGVVAGAVVYLAAAHAFGVPELTAVLRRRGAH